ncbi:YggT family protein [Candidatus Saccharibacteria bacterium]|nr:YggT family protein [Candidatus Saccharibacteria bacterium]
MATDNSNKIEIPGYLRISKVIAYIMYAWVIIGVISLVLRVFLLAFSANPTTPFVEFVYKTSADYLNPFRGIFQSRPIGETGYFDVAAMFAIIIYLFIMWGFSSLIKYIQFKIDKTEHEQEKEIAARQRQISRSKSN